MNSLRAFVGLAVLVLSIAPGARAATTEDIRSAAHVIVYGELPTQTLAGTRVDQSLDQLVRSLKATLASDQNAAANVAAKAYRDTFGPTAASDDQRPSGVITYAECLRHDLALLADSPARYEAAIRAAYPQVIHRDVYPEEIAYWKKHGPVPYYLLLAAIDNWARRNQPGLMVTAGVPTVSINSEYLVTVRISPEKAAAVRALLQLPALSDAEHSATAGVLAPGGENLETDGGMYFVASGR